jgi:hypothetical protein
VPSLARSLAMALVIGALASALSACTEVETNKSKYSPTLVNPIKGRDDTALVQLTPAAAARAGVRTGVIRRLGRQTYLPYAGLLYDDDGITYTYVIERPYVYVRQPVHIARITGHRVILRKGPPAGTQIVTTGAAEIYSAEFGVEE